MEIDRARIERVVRDVIEESEASGGPPERPEAPPGTVAIGADHGGFALKETLKRYLTDELGYRVLDVGTPNEGSCDYPDFAAKVARAVSEGRCKRGILICGSGIGMSMAANRFPRVRAALCNDLFSAIMSRRHNDANVLAMGGRIIGDALAKEIVDAWLSAEFEGGRHQKRIETMDDIVKQKED